MFGKQASPPVFLVLLQNTNNVLVSEDVVLFVVQLNLAATVLREHHLVADRNRLRHHDAVSTDGQGGAQATRCCTGTAQDLGSTLDSLMATLAYSRKEHQKTRILASSLVRTRVRSDGVDARSDHQLRRCASTRRHRCIDSPWAPSCLWSYTCQVHTRPPSPRSSSGLRSLGA